MRRSDESVTPPLRDVIAELEPLLAAADPAPLEWLRRHELQHRINEYAFIEVKLSATDATGREAFYAVTWELVKAIPDTGAKTGLMLTTGLTDIDRDGVRAQVEIRRRS